MSEHTATASRSRVDRSAVLARIYADESYRQLIDVIETRADRWVANPTLEVPGELADWWHVTWERLGDVAFTQVLKPNPLRGEWIRREILRLCALPVDEWIGPFFRRRGDVPVGALETAHVGLGVADVLELCPDVFSDMEREIVLAALEDHCVLPCERAIEGFESQAALYRSSGGESGTALNNWYAVLLDGFAAAAMAIGDAERVGTLPGRYRRAAALYDVDSYGESVQYSGYAALHLSNLHEMIERRDPQMAAGLPVPYSATMRWLAHSIMFSGPRPEFGSGRYMTMVNFGDSAVTARPPSDVLTSIARLGTGVCNEDAQLARWLFDFCYRDIQVEPSDLSTFGFFSQIGWRTVINLLTAVEARSPQQLGIPIAEGFHTGTVAVRDRWDTPRTVLAAQAGHPALAVDGHRHDDHGSFVLAHRGELLFADPGHCSYRLQAQQTAKRSDSHSTWTIRSASTNEHLERHHAHGSPVGVRTGPTRVEDHTVFSVDLADQYPASITRARRTWITLLPHVVLIVDALEATEAVTVDARFVLNDRDHRLRVNEATGTRLVLRRGEAAAKFFQLAAEADDGAITPTLTRTWSALHDVYQPQPNAPTQGREGSAVVYTFIHPVPTRSHRAIYSIVLDREVRIRGWHVQLDERGIVQIQRPDGSMLAIDPNEHADDATARS